MSKQGVGASLLTKIELGSIPRRTAKFVGALCNGSTTDFDSVSLGSIPNAPASLRILTANLIQLSIGEKRKCILFNYIAFDFWEVLRLST